MTLTADQIRRCNLIEVLQDDAPGVPEPPESAVLDWTEDDIRKYFASNGQVVPGPKRQAPAPVPQEEFDRWFPSMQRSGTKVPDGKPAMRLLCLCSSGNSEDMFSSEGTGTRRAPSPLLEWCRANRVEMMAVQYPGRANRSRDPTIPSATDMAREILRVGGSKLAEVPWAVLGHSVGCLVAYEIIRLAPSIGVPLPVTAVMAAFIAPDTDEARRPWRRNRGLSEGDFQSEVRAWGANEAVFSDAFWPMYHKILRSDYTMFDEYVYAAQDTRAPVRLVAQWATEDTRITKDLVEGWERETAGEFVLESVEGPHMFPLDKDLKRAWLEKVVGHLRVTLKT